MFYGFSLSEMKHVREMQCSTTYESFDEKIFNKRISQEMLRFDLCDLSGKKVSSLEFNTHTELDQWAALQFDKVKGVDRFKKKYPKLYELLKGYDLAFKTESEKSATDINNINEQIENMLNRQKEVSSDKGKKKTMKDIKQLQNQLERVRKRHQICCQGTQCAFP